MCSYQRNYGKLFILHSMCLFVFITVKVRMNRVKKCLMCLLLHLLMTEDENCSHLILEIRMKRSKLNLSCIFIIKLAETILTVHLLSILLTEKKTQTGLIRLNAYNLA